MNYLRAIFCSIVLTLTFGGASLPAIAQSMPSCPGDTVVWENTSTKVYHESGDKYFGKTKKGTYACKADADKAGFHLSGSKSKGSSSTSAGSAMSSAAPDSDASSAPAPGASPTGKHHKHKKGSAMSASPAPGAMTSPGPDASPTGKHRHHKKGAMASPAPTAT